jgi:hypothetical protein
MAYMQQQLVYGLGAAASTAGTYQDPNCPLSCWIAGNVLDMELLGQECWPCHNICPPGTSWDAAALVCDTTGAGAPEAIPTTTGDASGNPCPDGTVWNATDGQCENPVIAGIGSYLPWIVGGLGIFAVLMLVKK